MPFTHGHALLIGVGSYAHHPAPKDLPATVRDAEALRQVLRDPTLCGYPDGQIALLTGQAALRDPFLAELDSLAQVTPDATVLIYFAGHGFYGQDGDYYLTSHDTRLAGARVVTGTGVSEKVLLEKLRAIPARRLILLFNACHAGELMPAMGAGDPTSPDDVILPDSAAAAILATGEGRVVITACRPQQQSYIAPGQPLTLFGQALMDGLSGRSLYIASNAGYVSAFALYEHIYHAVLDAIRPYGAQQEPVLSVLNNVGPFPVALYKGASAMGAFDAGEALPPTTAANPIDPALSRRLLERYIPAVRVSAAGEWAIAVGGNVEGSTLITGDSNTVSQHTAFDQRGQTVGSQTNVAGDFHGGPIGGDKVGGDKITVGDVSGAGIAIGRGARAVATSGLDAAALSQALAPLYRAAGQLADADAQAQAWRQVDGLQAELARGAQADDSRVARLIDGLVTLAPGVASAVASAFGSPILAGAAGPVTRFVLDKLSGS